MLRTATVLLFLFITNGILAQMPNTISKSDKVYGLSKFWQEVNYNFIYLDKVDREKWNETYKQLITEVQETPNDYEYYLLLKKFCAQLKDGHTNINFPRNINDQLLNTNFGEYRLFVDNIGGKAIVTRTNVSKKDEIPSGTEIISVNGMPTQEYLDKHVKPYIASSTDYVLQDWAVNQMFKAPEGVSYAVEFKLPNGKIKLMKLTHTRTTEKEIYPPYRNNEWPFEFEWKEKKIAHLRLHSFADPLINEKFEAKLPEIRKAKGVIIDLRTNGGGNTSIGLDILKYFTNDTILYGSRNSSRLHIPSYKAWSKAVTEKDTANSSWAKQSYLSGKDQYYHYFEYAGDTIHDTIDRIIVPVVVLMGHNTASAAEDFLIYVDKQEHMTTMGERSFGSTGQPIDFTMPGNGYARICTKKDTYPDGREFVGYGVEPDIYVHKTLEEFLGQKDRTLEKAIQHLKTKM